MAVSSTTPLVRKLGIKEGHAVSFINPPKTFSRSLGDLPTNVKLDRASPGGLFDVIVFFTHSRAELQREFRYLAGRLQPNGGLWIGWPKKSSGVSTDLSETVVREVAIARGLIDNKVCPIDEGWTAARLVIKPKEKAK